MKKKKSELYRNEIKSYIVRAGMTMSEVVDYLADEYGWSSSVPNLSGKLKRGSLRYGEAVELADALGYDIVWVWWERNTSAMNDTDFNYLMLYLEKRYGLHNENRSRRALTGVAHQNQYHPIREYLNRL